MDAVNPPPFVPVLSKDAFSPTLYPEPDSIISKSSTTPFEIESTKEIWSTNSLDSTIKSLLAKGSATLYGNVFLAIVFLLKS